VRPQVVGDDGHEPGGASVLARPVAVSSDLARQQPRPTTNGQFMEGVPGRA